MTSIFEQLGGTYTQGNDGMLYPNLTLGDREQRPIGRWGRMHRGYLETEHLSKGTNHGKSKTKHSLQLQSVAR